MTHVQTHAPNLTARDWLTMLLAVVRLWTTEFHINVLIPLAFGPPPTPRQVRDFADKLARSEARLRCLIHHAARIHCGLPPERNPKPVFLRGFRSGKALAGRLGIHVAMLQHPERAIARIVLRMRADAARRTSPAAIHDPAFNTPAAIPIHVFTPSPHPQRALELSG